MELEGFSTPRGGSFVDSLEAILKDDPNYALNTRYESSAKVVEKFLKNENFCLMGGSISLFKYYGITTENYIESASFWHVRYVLFTTKNKPLINNVGDLSGKRIGVYRSDLVVFKKFLPNNANIVEVKSKRQLYKILSEGKIDVALDGYPLLPKYSSKVHFNPDLLLIEFSIAVICSKNDRNTKFISYINEKLKLDKNKEKIRSTFERYYK